LDRALQPGDTLLDEHREIKPAYIPRKGEVNAASLGEIGEGDPNVLKCRILELNAE